MSGLAGIEVIRADAAHGRARHVLFDFDGTLSLIREGWQNVMIPYFVGELSATPNHDGEDEAALRRVVVEFVERLTGKQTIYQCFALADEVKARGGEPQEPLAYKHEYLRRLWQRIEHRVAGLRSGAASPDEFLVRGSRALLEGLRSRGIACYLASGTDIAYVRDESDVLDVARYFDGRIYGALDSYRDFSKQMIIDKILGDNGLSGPELAVIGDGYVEIENGKGVGGIAVGLASDEANPGGIDEWKRQRLIAAGADIIVRDFAETEPLLEYITGIPAV